LSVTSKLEAGKNKNALKMSAHCKFNMTSQKMHFPRQMIIE
jgi:hypothetical protein